MGTSDLRPGCRRSRRPGRRRHRRPHADRFGQSPGLAGVGRGASPHPRRARDPALATGLDPIDATIVHRALDALTGAAAINTDAWHTLTTQQLADLVTTTVAAACGDPDATNTLQPLLDELAAHPDWAPLAAILTHIIAGERDPILLGLDHPSIALITTILDRLNQRSNST